MENREISYEEAAAENEGMVTRLYNSNRTDFKARRAYEQLEAIAGKYGLSRKDFEKYFFCIPDSMRRISLNIINDFRRDHKKDVDDPEFKAYASRVIESYARNIDEIGRFDDKF